MDWKRGETTAGQNLPHVLCHLMLSIHRVKIAKMLREVEELL